MANWTHFYAHSFDTPRWAETEQPPLSLYGKNIVPLFWYSPFTTSNVCTRPLTLSAGEALEVPGLMTTSALGLARSRARREFFAQALPPELLHFYDDWLQLLADAGNERYFQLDPSELGCLLEPKEIAAWLDEAIRALDGDESMLSSLFDNPGLEFDASTSRVTRFDAAGVPFILAGAAS